MKNIFNTFFSQITRVINTIAPICNGPKNQDEGHTKINWSADE